MLPMFSRSRRPPIQEARLPDGVRVYAIGDIHGSVGLLHRLHDRILADSHTAPAGFNVLIYLGDYIDRGLDSRGVLDILATGPLPGFEAVYLKGNHEAALLEFLDDAERGRDCLRVGGQAALRSYGIRPPDPQAPVAG